MVKSFAAYNFIKLDSSIYRPTLTLLAKDSSKYRPIFTLLAKDSSIYRPTLTLLAKIVLYIDLHLLY